MTGYKIKLGSGASITKDGKLKVVPIYRDASQAIAAKKRPKQKYGRGIR